MNPINVLGLSIDYLLLEIFNLQAEDNSRMGRNLSDLDDQF
jgi:hypothetical protein